MPTKKRKTPRETSDRVSRIAARVLARAEGWPKSGRVCIIPGPYNSLCSLGELLSLAGTALSQDQTRGPRGRK